ncbi:MAG: type II secretion system protein [Elusimicrobiota bacterium]|nr:type II secretion system protein [Elusimicrobiota bacterium]
MARHRPRRLIDRRAGYTLVEVVIAVLLTSIMVTSVFSVALTSKQGGGKSDRRLVAAQAAKRMTSQLRNFVTGCDCNATTGVCSAASCTIQGPTPRAGVASWYLNDPTNAVNDSRGDVWALASGVHTITGTGVLPAWFLAAPFNGSVQYTVDNSVVVNGRPVPQVTLDVVWTEP